MAYAADGRSDLLKGINEFLDDSMVFPPGDWDYSTLLPAMQIVKQKEREKKRLKEQKAAAAVKKTGK